MNTDRTEPVAQLQGSPAPEPAEQELYAALRAAGASPEFAQSCCNTPDPSAAE